jgi:GNAT superfamily N-acetyltransferase
MKNTKLDHFYTTTGTTLTKAETAAALALSARCREHDGIRLSYPAGEGEADYHCLLWGEDSSDPVHSRTLLSVFAVIAYDEETTECSAFTDPDYRRHGYFSELLDLVLEKYEERALIFPVSGSCADTLAVLEAMEARLDLTEHTMELDLDDAYLAEHKLPDISEAEAAPDGSWYLTMHASAQDLFCPDEGACGLVRRYFSELNEADRELNISDSEHFGRYDITSVSDHCVCLHHVEVDEAHRGQGHATCMLEKLFALLAAAGIKKVILQVSGDNDAALALYKKTGFRITETLSYYLY